MKSMDAAKLDQKHVWNSVERLSKVTGTHSATHAYCKIYEQPKVYNYIQEVEKEIDFNIAQGAQ